MALMPAPKFTQTQMPDRATRDESAPPENNRQAWRDAGIKVPGVEPGMVIRAGGRVFQAGGLPAEVQTGTKMPSVTSSQMYSRFWENPQRVDRYYNAVKSAPVGWQAPDWLETDKLEAAHQYLRETNVGREAWEWRMDDGARELLRTLQLPPAQMVPDYDHGDWPDDGEARYHVTPEMVADFKTSFGLTDTSMFDSDKDGGLWVSKDWVDAQIAKQDTQIYTPGALPEMKFGMPAEQFDALPGWQKAVLPNMPWAQKLFMMGGGALGGAVTGSAIMPGVGTAVGAVAGAAGMGTLAALAERGGVFAKFLNGLDLPAEGVERILGTMVQLSGELGQSGGEFAESIVRGEPFLELEGIGEIITHPGAAWRASSLYYESIGAEQNNGFGKPRTVQGFTGKWEVPDSETAGGYAMDEVRNRLINIQPGETPEQIMAEAKMKFGLAGTLKDLAGHMLLDPLNLLGAAVAKAGAAGIKVAKAGKGAQMFGKALDTTVDASRLYDWDLSSALKQWKTEVRGLDAATRADLSPMSKFMAGLNEAGEWKTLERVSPDKMPWISRAVNSLIGETPASRAKSVIDHTTDLAGVAIADATSPEDVVKLIEGMAYTKVEDVAAKRPTIQGLDGEAIRVGIMDGAEAQAVPLALADQMPKVYDEFLKFKNSREKFSLIEAVAGELGMKPEKLVDTLWKGTVEDAERIVSQFKGVLENKNDKRVAALSGFDGAALKETATIFKTGKVPVNLEQFKAKMTMLIHDSTDAWAAKWFDVKPKGTVYRLTDVMKKAQSIVLLGLNPTYVLNNAINNTITLAWDGLLGMSSKTGREAFYSRMGFKPQRAWSGMDMGELTARGVGAVEAASRGKDWIQSANDFLSKPVFQKLAVFAKASQQIEQASSDMAVHTALRRYMDQAWRAGSGFDSVETFDPMLAKTLDEIEPGLREMIETAVSNGLNTDEITANIRGAFGRNNVGQKGLKHVMTREELELTSAYPDVMDRLNEGLRTAKTRDDRTRTVQQAKREIFDAMKEQVQREVKDIEEADALRVRMDGVQGALESITQIADARADFWQNHFRNMEEASRLAGLAVDKQTRNLIWRNAMEQADGEWALFREVENARQLGVMKALGLKDDDAVRYSAALDQMGSGWDAFFKERKAKLSKHYETEFKTPEEADADLARVTAELNNQYADEINLEAVRQMDLDSMFVKQAREQLGDEAAKAAEQWRKGTAQVRARMTAAETYYRTGQVMPGLNKDLRAKIDALKNGALPSDNLQNAYRQEVYLPLIREQAEAARFAVGIRKGEEVKRVRIPDGTPLGQVNRLKDWFNDRGWTRGMKGLVNAVNEDIRTSGRVLDSADTTTQYTKWREIPFEEARRAVEKRTKIDLDAERERLRQKLGDETMQDNMPPVVNAPLGTADSLTPPPTLAAMLETMGDVHETLDKAAMRLEADPLSGATFDPGKITDDVRARLADYAEHVKGQLTETKLAARHYAMMKRDAALLNYEKRTGMDNLMGAVWPYQFWYTRSMLNWAVRAMGRPVVLNNYQRIQNITTGNQEREGYPYRLKNKMVMYAPFLPDWMGDGIYMDPMKQAFPLLQIARPWEQIAEEKNMEVRKAESAIRELVYDDQISAEEAQAAIDSKSGAIWERGLATARQEAMSDTSSPWDLGGMIMGYGLPVSMAVNWAMGREAKIGQLPITRAVQAVTGAMGIGGPRGVNLEGWARRKMGMPEIDRFEDYRVARVIANMTAEGEISADEALRAMVDRQGEAYAAAQRRVSQLGLAQYIGSPLGVDFFPEGEQTQRQLAAEYDRAIEARKAGDSGALTRFYEAYPEFRARQLSFDASKPEEQLRSFLRSEIWQRYMALGEADKDVIANKFGDMFSVNFLDKETRSYDSIDTNTYAMWAKALGTRSDATSKAAGLGIEFTPKDVSAALKQYRAEPEAMFPGIKKLMNAYYNMDENSQKQLRAAYPQIGEYERWKNDYLANNAKIIPYVIGEDNQLAGLPTDVQGEVYGYRAGRDQIAPDYDNLTDQYFNLPDDQKSAFMRAHPELSKAWDFQTEYASSHPKAAPYILSDDRLSQAIMGNRAQLKYYYDQKDARFPDIAQKWDEYYSLEGRERNAYYKANPDLKAYSNWKKVMAAAMPEIAVDILGEDRVSDLILPEAQINKVVDSLSGETGKQLVLMAKEGEAISSGARMEMERLFEELGSPGGDFDTWLESVMLALGL